MCLPSADSITKTQEQAERENEWPRFALAQWPPAETRTCASLFKKAGVGGGGPRQPQAALAITDS